MTRVPTPRRHTGTWPKDRAWRRSVLLGGKTNRLAVYSHILPPSPSGQATVLARLLQHRDSASIRLIRSQEGGIGFVAQPLPVLEAGEIGSHSATVSKLERRQPFAPKLVRALMRRSPLAVPATWCRANQLAGYLQSEGCSSLVVCSGGFEDMPEGFLAARWARIPVIAYYFDWYGMQWETLLRHRVALWIEARLIREFDAVIVPNEALREALARRYDIRPIVIHNPCAEQALSEGPVLEWPAFGREISIVYTGAIYHANLDALRTLTAAISAPEMADMRLHIYTSQPNTVLQNQGANTNVVFHEHLPPVSIAEVQRRADVLYLPLAFESRINEVLRTSAPGKMADYLATGRPILVHAPPHSFVNRYFREHNCGVVVDSKSPAAVAEALNRIATDASLRRVIGEKARERARVDFDPTRAREIFRSVVYCIEGH